jgi:hypothetical protein
VACDATQTSPIDQSPGQRCAHIDAGWVVIRLPRACPDFSETTAWLPCVPRHDVQLRITGVGQPLVHGLGTAVPAAALTAAGTVGQRVASCQPAAGEPSTESVRMPR